MHAQPPRTLKRLLKQYGQELIDDPRRTEALLRDYCGQHTREIFVLINAQKQRIPSELLGAPTWMPRQATHSRLVRLLETKLAITEDAAEWAVTSWATALELEMPQKNGAWSWLPEPIRTATTQSTRKTRSKKRQNSATGVQYKENSKTSARQAKERAARAELGWSFPKIDLSQWGKQLSTPSARATLLTWAGLIAVTIFLLGFIYWSSTARDFFGTDELGALDTTGIATTTAAGTRLNAANETQNANAAATTASVSSSASQSTQSDLSQLPRLPREYLNDVMQLPTLANVNTDTLNIRRYPTTEADVLGFLGRGESLRIVAYSEDGQWSQIQNPYLGWVSNDFLLFQSHDVTGTSVRLNVHLRRTQRYEVDVRSGPYANAKVIATLPADEVVVVAATVGEPAQWVQIADPAIGWVATNDLTTAP